MIAEPSRHVEQETLQALLDESLSVDQAARVESHLCQCDRCRTELEQLAGDPAWWNETIGVLSDSTLGLTAPSSSKHSEAEQKLDASLEWIRPLLEPSSSGGLGRIDQYPIGEVIGQGGMGVVLRGTDTELHRPVAVKILSPHLAGVGAARARFMREAQAAAAIIHPSIVPIYSIATAGRLPYIVMPWISGGNLQQRIDREGPLELIEILRISLQIAEGLAAAHRHGVIHRDIKPGNILTEEGNGRVLISDFGLARALDDATLTMSGMIAGTPQYMSPEQARGDLVDARSDLFSLGSLMYALATGRPPFRAESPLAVLRKISESKPRPVRMVNERIPEWLDRIIGRLMETERTKRIQTAEEAADILRQSLTHAQNPSAAPLPTAIQRRYGRPRFFAGLAALLIPLAGWAIYQAFASAHIATPQTVLPVGQSPARQSAADSSLGANLVPLDWEGAAIQHELATTSLRIDQLHRTLAGTEQFPLTVNESPKVFVPSSAEPQ